MSFNIKGHISSVRKQLEPTLGPADPVNTLLTDEVNMLTTLETHVTQTIASWPSDQPGPHHIHQPPVNHTPQPLTFMQPVLLDQMQRLDAFRRGQVYSTKERIKSVEKALVSALGADDPVNTRLCAEINMLMTLNRLFSDTITGWLTWLRHLRATAPPFPPAPEDNVEGLPDNQVCLLCLSRLRTVVCQPCGHCMTCTDCWLRWAEDEHQKNRCPSCRALVKRIEILRPDQRDSLAGNPPAQVRTAQGGLIFMTAHLRTHDRIRAMQRLLSGV